MVQRASTGSPAPTSITRFATLAMDDDLTMLIGPGTNGVLLEIGVLDLNGDDPVVIHAMTLRARLFTSLQ